MIDTTTPAPAIEAEAAPVLFVTRFDVRETENGDELRLFAKRSKVAAFGVEDISREGWDEDTDGLQAFIDAEPRTVEQVEAWLTCDEGGEEGEGEDGRGTIVPEKYRVLYGADQNCGDDMALTMTAFVTLPRVKGSELAGGLDRAKLRIVAEVNGIGHKLADWEDRQLNGGQLRMNTGNVLRGMLRRGERVEVGQTIWEANPELAASKVKKVKAAPLTHSAEGELQ